jgi:drug/metabolite transporter (DMT)-like permease
MAASYILIGRRLRKKMTLVSYTFLVYGAAAVMLVIFMLAGGFSPLGYPPVTYLWFVLLALIPQLLGHSSINWALGYLSAASVSTILLGEPIGSTILAVILLNEMPGVVKILGAGLILGAFLRWRGEKSAKNAKHERSTKDHEKQKGCAMLIQIERRACHNIETSGERAGRDGSGLVPGMAHWLG